MSNPTSPLMKVRYPADRDSAKSLLQDREIKKILSGFDGDAASAGARKDLLANAVRIDAEILPDLDLAINAIKERAGITDTMETYVYQHPMIQASVFRSGTHLFVILSSAALEKLTPQELEFVIGHEIGHVTYDHFSIPTFHILDQTTERLSPRRAVEILSWQRKAEISADRAGLLCCGSLDVASSAFFKVISGLSMEGLRVNPLRLANQFDHLRDEIWQRGAEDMWAMTHPLSPLRMKSMAIFWESEQAAEWFDDAPNQRTAEACDREIGGLLSFMDPISTRSDSEVDPVLLPFLTWGGLYLAAANRVIDKSELRAIAEMVGENYLKTALQEKRTARVYRQKFFDALEARTHPLSALDINRIVTSLILIARADGSIDPKEVAALHDLAQSMGIDPSFVDGMIDHVE